MNDKRVKGKNESKIYKTIWNREIVRTPTNSRTKKNKGKGKGDNNKQANE